MCVPFSQNLKKKSVNGEQNMKILRKKRRNWPKKCQRKGKNKKTRHEYQQLTKYIDRLQNENLGIHRGAGIPDLKTKQAQTEN